MEIKEEVRGKDVYLIQPTVSPQTNLLELIFMITALKRSSVKSITAVIPYYGFCRQDVMDVDKGRNTISSSDISHILESLGCNRILTMDLHSMQAQGSVSSRMQWDSLQGLTLALSYFRPKGELKLKNPCIVASGDTKVKRAKQFQAIL